MPVLVLFGGPAGAGKSTLARAWGATRPRAVHIELDAVRGLIMSGLADAQQASEEQSRQYKAAVRASCALARSYVQSGFDVAIDDVLEPDAFQRAWLPSLAGLTWQVLIVLPALEEVLSRAHARSKRVKEHVIHQQHASCSAWPAELLLDTTGLTVQESLALGRQQSLLP